MSQGIFLKIFELFENSCHELDLKLALVHSGESSISLLYTTYVHKLHKLKKAKADHDITLQNLLN